jgi:hypothetical protein
MAPQPFAEDSPVCRLESPVESFDFARMAALALGACFEVVSQDCQRQELPPGRSFNVGAGLLAGLIKGLS